MSKNNSKEGIGMSKVISTAIFMKSESCDYYLLNVAGELNKEECISLVESKTGESRECFCDFIVKYAKEEA